MNFTKTYCKWVSFLVEMLFSAMCKLAMVHIPELIPATAKMTQVVSPHS